MAIQLTTNVDGGYTGDYWRITRFSTTDLASAASEPLSVVYALYKDAAANVADEASVSIHTSTITLDMTAITSAAGQYEQLLDDAAIAQDTFFSGGSQVA